MKYIKYTGNTANVPKSNRSNTVQPKLGMIGIQNHLDTLDKHPTSPGLKYPFGKTPLFVAARSPKLRAVLLNRTRTVELSI